MSDDHYPMCANHGDCEWPVFLVTVGGRINSAWRTKRAAQEQYDRLIDHNGNQIGAAVQEIEVRT